MSCNFQKPSSRRTSKKASKANKFLVRVFLIAFIIINLISHQEFIWKRSSFTLEPLKTLSNWFSKTLSQQQLHQLAKLITVQVVSENSRGSGILIEKQDGFYTVLTNAHVIEKGKKHTIYTYDGQTYEAQILFNLNQDESGDDLAVLQFYSQQDYKIAILSPFQLENDETVFAAGFPSSTNQLLFLNGAISLILERPLKQGYQIGNLIDIEKGMSGGPLLNQKGEVVGINGKHNYPLWGNKEFYKDGLEVDKPTNLLRQSSWAIPIQTFVKQAPEILIAQMNFNLSRSNDLTRTVNLYEKNKNSDINLNGNYKFEENTQNLELDLERSLLKLTKIPEVSKIELPKLKNIIFFSWNIKDLDNDGEAEFILDLIVHDNHRYSYSFIYYYIRQQKKYEYIDQKWGLIDDREDYIIKDIEADGIFEFHSLNRKLYGQDFNEEYLYYPLQIWRYNQGKLEDVTHEYKELVYSQALRLWRDYKVRSSRNNVEIKGLLAAYLADKQLLCQKDDGWEFIKANYQSKDSEEYFQQLNNLLRDKPLCQQ